jgi:hypothetical protein
MCPAWNAAVPKAVNAALPNAVNVAVANAVNASVPNAVNAAIAPVQAFFIVLFLGERLDLHLFDFFLI